MSLPFDLPQDFSPDDIEYANYAVFEITIPLILKQIVADISGVSDPDVPTGLANVGKKGCEIILDFCIKNDMFEMCDVVKSYMEKYHSK